MKVLTGLLSVIIDDETAEAIANAATPESAREVVIEALRTGHQPKLLAARSLVAEGTDLIDEEILDRTRNELDAVLLGAVSADLLRMSMIDLGNSDNSDLH